MAEYSGFFDGPQSYGQAELARYFENVYESGISMINDNEMSFKVFGSNGSVRVSTGFAIIKGFYLYSDTDKSINITKDNNYTRLDRIVLRLNLSTKKVTIEHRVGVASSNPSVPSLQRDSLIYELSLAEITVNTNNSVVVNDTRVNKSLCGAIRPKNLTEFNSLINSFTDRFDKWFESQQSKGWRNIYIQSYKPSEGIEGSLWKQTL